MVYYFVGEIFCTEIFNAESSRRIQRNRTEIFPLNPFDPLRSSSQEVTDE